MGHLYTICSSRINYYKTSSTTVYVHIYVTTVVGVYISKDILLINKLPRRTASVRGSPSRRVPQQGRPPNLRRHRRRRIRIPPDNAIFLFLFIIIFLFFFSISSDGHQRIMYRQQVYIRFQSCQFKCANGTGQSRYT